MARKPRIHYPEALYHVMLRGNAKQAIFDDQDDVRRFEKILGQSAEKYDTRIYAYCWMPNHIHMALQVSDIPLSKMMQNLSQRYTSWFNHRHQRVGHLFQGRYKAMLVDAQEYLQELIRYIHLNPVRAGLVSQPSAYKNSSHAAYLTPKCAAPWLCVDAALNFFGSTESSAQAAYLHFMGQPLNDKILNLLRKGVSEGRVLGDDEFVRKMTNKMDEASPSDLDLDTLTRMVAEKMDVSEDDIFSTSRCRKITEARGVIALLAIDQAGYNLKSVAGYLNRDITTLSKQLQKLRGQGKGKNFT